MSPQEGYVMSYELELADVGSLELAVLAGGDVKLDSLALVQGLVNHLTVPFAMSCLSFFAPQDKKLRSRAIPCGPNSHGCYITSTVLLIAHKSPSSNQWPLPDIWAPFAK